MTLFFRISLILDNLNSPDMTSKNSQDRIIKKMKLKKYGESNIIVQLGYQRNLLLQSIYAETWGLDRKKGESLYQFIQRALESNIMRDSNCEGMGDSVTNKIISQNTHIKTCKHTYYFAMATGYRKYLRTKQRELFKEPVKLCHSALGFDSDVRLNLSFTNNIKKPERRDVQNPVTIVEHFYSYLKTMNNLLNLTGKATNDLQPIK